MYQKIEEFSIHILAAILIGNLLTAVAVWYEIYYVANDSASATVKAILIDAVAAAALGIYVVGTVDAFMVLSKLILEKYLNNRFVAGEAKGRQEANKEWQAWYDRMVEAGKRGEDFDEPPPIPPKRKQ